MEFVSRIVEKYLQKLAEDLSVPPQWDAFLKARYEGGKKRVPNTNPKTKDRYPNVTVRTLFNSDDGFKKKLMDEYAAWVVDGKKKSDPPKTEKRGNPIVSVATREAIDAYHKQYAEVIREAVDTLNSPLRGIRVDIDGEDDRFTKSEQEGFDEDAQKLAKHSSKVGEEYEQANPKAGRRLRTGIFSQWRKGVGRPMSQEMLNWVSGQPTTLTKTDKQYLVDQYLFTQAFFKEAGITHVTVYRGVMGQVPEDTPEGSDAEVSLSTLSSWSFHPKVAADFGRLCTARIPVEQVFASPLTDPAFGLFADAEYGGHGECECVVMNTGEPVKVKVGK